MANNNVYFSMGNTAVDEFLSSALSEYNPSIVDAIYTGIPALRYLNSKDRIKKNAAGYSFVQPVRYAKNNTAAFISPTGTVSLQQQNNATSVQFKYRTLVDSIVLTDDEMDVTSDHQVYDLAESKAEDAKLAGMDLLAQALFAAAPDTTTKIESFPTLIATTGSIGDQSPTNNAWWQSTVTSSGSVAAQGVKDATTLYNTISKSLMDPPDLGIMTQTAYESLEATMRGYAQYDTVRDGSVDVGLPKGGLKFKGQTLFWDENCTSGTWFMINTNYLYLKVFPNADFKINPFIRPANQVLKAAIIRWKGALVCTNRARMGKLTGLTA